MMSNDDLYCIIESEQLPIYYAPGKTYNYCNTNYALIPVIIERIAQVPFRTYVKEKIFEPLGMFDSEYIDAFHRNSMEYPVLGHYPNGKKKLPFYLNGVIGDKGLYSTVYDLLKLYFEISNPVYLSDSMLNVAFEPKCKTSVDRYYGLGWRIFAPKDQEAIIYHNGWWRGFRSYFWFSREEDKCVVILTNTIRGGYLNQSEIWSLY